MELEHVADPGALVLPLPNSRKHPPVASNGLYLWPHLHHGHCHIPVQTAVCTCRRHSGEWIVCKCMYNLSHKSMHTCASFALVPYSALVIPINKSLKIKNKNATFNLELFTFYCSVIKRIWENTTWQQRDSRWDRSSTVFFIITQKRSSSNPWVWKYFSKID